MKKRVDIAILSGFILFFVITLSLAIFLPKTSRGSYGEFPFKLVYEIDGERYTIEDTLVYKSMGVSYGDNGKGEGWDSYLLSEKKTKYNGNTKTFAFTLLEKGNLSIKFCVSDLHYYMANEENSPDEIDAGEVYIYPENRALTDEELYEKYGIKIIEKYISPPITEQAD